LASISRVYLPMMFHPNYIEDKQDEILIIQEGIWKLPSLVVEIFSLSLS
jgi:hypothetical protein